MAWTVLTMMAVFNPLNFGVWGIIMAPVTAMTLGGICFVLYKVLTHEKHEKHHEHGHHHMGGGHHHHEQIHHHHAPPAEHHHKPHEIIIRNKINHEAIPIKIEHFHKHIPVHKLVYSHYSHHHSAPKAPPKPAPPPLPMMHEMHEAPVMEYSPPWDHTAKQSYGEPPVDSYFPTAHEGGPYPGPYKRKSSMHKHKSRKQNPFKYKLL